MKQENGNCMDLKMRGKVEEKEENSVTIASNEPKKGPFFGVRHSQIFLMFVLSLVTYATRLNLSIAIVAMTDPTINKDVKTYNWGSRGSILSAFYWGYFIPQFAAGYFSDKFGAFWILAVGMGMNSLLCAAIPIVADFGPGYVIACRFLQGLSQGPVFPCMQSFLGKWTPQREIARFAALTNSGTQVGAIITTFFTGWISSTSFGWPYSFYYNGSLCFLWTVFWLLFGYDSPSVHKTISYEEKIYINETLFTAPPDEKEQKVKTPWKHIVLSFPFWSVILYAFLNDWAYMVFTIETPTYMNSVLKYDIKSNGLYSSMPYVLNCVTAIACGSLFDYVINKKFVTTGVCRKISAILGAGGPALLLILLGSLNLQDKAYVAVIFLILGFALQGIAGNFSGTNILDLSPRFGGTLMGIANTAGNICASIAPVTIELIVRDKENAMEWCAVFYIAAGLQLLAAAIYIIFGSGEKQKWDNLKREEKKTTEEIETRNP